MFAVGFILFGSTVLLPLYLQTLMGYTATDAGLALSPGGFVVMVMMPIIGIALTKFEARWLILIGLIISSLALYHMTSFNLQIDYRTAASARIFQSMGLAFLFVPINTAAYVGIPKGKNNNASSIINLSRNLGGSFGIALVTTMLARRAQFHQSRLIEHLTPSDPQYQTVLQNMAHTFMTKGASASQAMAEAQAIIYGLVQKQANMLAFLDNFWLLSIFCLFMIPLVFLMKRNRPGPGGAAMH
jgi:DHA2 family multidrug resistance protein